MARCQGALTGPEGIYRGQKATLKEWNTFYRIWKLHLGNFLVPVTINICIVHMFIKIVVSDGRMMLKE